MTSTRDEPRDGLDQLFDPSFFLTAQQRHLLAELRALCEEKVRPRARGNDENLTFPRDSLEDLGPYLALMLPTEWGGLGEGYVMLAAATETIARYGDPSCAMCYTMHIGAVEAVRATANDYQIDNYLRKITSGVIGTLSFSDPETGSHFWYPLSSGARRTKGGYEVFKDASWTTSGGFADFYVIQTTSPSFKDYSDLTVWLVGAEDVDSSPAQWDALGLRGNQSGPIKVDWKYVPDERVVGRVGDGAWCGDEIIDPLFLLQSSSCWNGVSLAALDTTVRHATRKTHKDVGLRVADYATIQDAVGETIIATNAARCMTYALADALDRRTEGGQAKAEQGVAVRSDFLHWLWQVKFVAAKNVTEAGDQMLHCCGGSGFKRSPLDVERFLRDGKAGWLMAPTNEVARQFIGKIALLGMDSLDYWNTVVNERAMNNELKKLTPTDKRALAERLLSEAETEGQGLPVGVAPSQ